MDAHEAERWAQQADVRRVLFRLPAVAECADCGTWEDCVTDDVVLRIANEPELTADRWQETVGIDAFAEYYASRRDQVRLVVNPVVEVAQGEAHARSAALVLKAEAHVPAVAQVERVTDVLRQDESGDWHICERTIHAPMS